jgi:hypothetical protein
MGIEYVVGYKRTKSLDASRCARVDGTADGLLVEELGQEEGSSPTRGGCTQCAALMSSWVRDIRTAHRSFSGYPFPRDDAAHQYEFEDNAFGASQRVRRRGAGGHIHIRTIVLGQGFAERASTSQTLRAVVLRACVDEQRRTASEPWPSTELVTR